MMPKNNVRKRNPRKYNYTSEDLAKAIHAVKNDGRTISEVSRCFGIPRTTLKLYSNEHYGGIKRPIGLGRKTIFQQEAESKLKTHIFLNSNPFYGIERNELRRLVYKFVEDNDLNYNFDKGTCMASKEWTCCFLGRHPTIKVRNSEIVSLKKTTALSDDEVKRFFDIMETIINKIKIEPDRIYNLDEAEIPTDLKRFVMPSSNENSMKTTSMFCANFRGHYIPPMIIFPGDEMDANLQNDPTTGAIYRCSRNGRSTSGLFLEWLAHFRDHVVPTEDNPVLLVLDNHNTHRSTRAHNFCRDNHIYMVPLPPHAYHLLQPLDLTFFSSLNNALYKEYELQFKLSSQERITGKNVAELLNKAFLKVATKSNTASGFEYSGVFPLNPQKFSKNDFGSSFQNLGPAGLSAMESSSSDDSNSQETHPILHEEHGYSAVME